MYIYIFVPVRYARFKRGRSKSSSPAVATAMVSYQQILYKYLLTSDACIKENIENGVIHVVEVPNDYGPATKVTGLLHLTNNIRSDVNPDYWIISDVSTF